MGSVFDFPPGVDLAAAVVAEKRLRAVGLSRRASLALIGIGVFEPRALHALAWDAPDTGQGLASRLGEAQHAGPAVVEEIRRWREIPWAD
jgi:hypothetical protein